MSRDDVIEDVKRVAALYNKPTITAREYTKYGKYSSSAVVRHIGSWNEILLQAEMPINENRNFTDEELFEEIERIWIMLGRQCQQQLILKKAFQDILFKVMHEDLAGGVELYRHL